MNEQGPNTSKPRELSSKNAAKILIDTVRELHSYGHTVSDTELSTYAENLGLIDILINQNPESEIEAAHKVSHDAKQAEYDKLALEIKPEVLPTIDWVKSNNDIYRKTITELATLLGEKPNFQKSKADYIVRAINKRDQQKDEITPRNTISATDALGIATVSQNESTQETVRALKAFNKKMLTGSVTVEGANPAEAQLPTAAEALVQLRADFQSLFDKKQAGELDEAGNKELLSTFVTILAATKAAARAEGKSEAEVKQAALDVEKEFAQQYGLIRKRKLPLPANDVAASSENIGKGRDKWGTPGRGNLAGSKLDLMTGPKQESKEKKRRSIRRKLGAAAMGIIAITGLYNLNRLAKDDDSTVKQDKTEQTTTTINTTTTRVDQNDMVPNDLRIKPESTASINTAEAPGVASEQAVSVYRIEAGGSPWSWMRTTLGLEGREDVIKQLYEQYKVQLGSLKGAYIDTKTGDVRFNKSISGDPAFFQELRAKANQLKNTPR